MLKCDHMRLTNKDDYFDIVTYAQWLETLSSLINRNIVNFAVIDDMYNYLFFVFVNNKYIQEVELMPSQKFYKGIYEAYSSWVNYLNKKNKEILCYEFSLEKVENYDLIRKMK